MTNHEQPTGTDDLEVGRVRRVLAYFGFVELEQASYEQHPQADRSLSEYFQGIGTPSELQRLNESRQRKNKN